MRRITALLFASALAASAWAGQDSTLEGSVESSAPEMLSEQYLEPISEEREWMSLREEEELMMQEEERMAALEEGEVIYIYPIEVTEYYLLVPVDPHDVAG